MNLRASTAPAGVRPCCYTVAVRGGGFAGPGEAGAPGMPAETVAAATPPLQNVVRSSSGENWSAERFKGLL